MPKKAKKATKKVVKKAPKKVEPYSTEDYFEMEDLRRKGGAITSQESTGKGMRFTFTKSKKEIEGGKANV